MFRSRHLWTNVNTTLNLLNQCSVSAVKNRQQPLISCLVHGHRGNHGDTADPRRGVFTSVSLTPEKVTEILSMNEVFLSSSQLLPAFIKSIECNQLASNNPIEDRLRVSSIQYPGLNEPTLMLGVFDGHGGGTTADIICRRLFNYIAISLHPDPRKLKISNRLSGSLVDLHNSPKLNNDPRLQTIETEMLEDYRNEVLASYKSHEAVNQEQKEAPLTDVAVRLKRSFQRCDDDLSQEIQNMLMKSTDLGRQALIHYSYAAISGCCAIVMVIHQGIAYIASSGDCRAVLGSFDRKEQTLTNSEQDLETKLVGHHIHPNSRCFRAIELNDEHNCDNINEVRRLAASHPKSEQNTMIKHNRLLGSLMPFRAFGDFQYKWTADVIKACGLTRTFQYFRVIPEHYETPPYLITEPDVRLYKINGEEATSANGEQRSQDQHERYIVMASDGLWELFESSRDVIETLVDHTINAYREGNEEDYDENCATYLLRSALRYGPHQDIGLDQERLRQLYHVRLQSTLTLPKTIARNYRDDISIVLVRI